MLRFLLKVTPIICLAIGGFFFHTTALADELNAFAVLEAAKTGDADKMRQLMQQPDILKMEDAEGNNVLMLAAKYNKDPMSVKAALNARFDIFKRNVAGENALLLSLENPNVRNLKNVIRAFTINGKLSGGEELLHKATAKKVNLERLQEIIDAKVDINAKDSKGKTPLMVALGNNSDIETIKFLLSVKADVNAFDNDKRTPLMYAAYGTSDREVLRTLINKGADLKATDKEGKTVLSYALQNSNPACISQLQKAGAVRNDKDYKFIANNTSARLNFVKTADDLELSKLIDMKADFKIKDKNGRTALMYAARYNPRSAVTAMLVSAGVKVNSVDDKGMTALDYAVKNPNANRIKTELVKAGAFVADNPMPKEDNVQKKLFEYAKTGTETEIETVLSHNMASINAKDEYGKTPLMLAAEYNQNPKVTEVLLRIGSSVELKDFGGYTPLMLAVRSNPNPQVIKVLLAGGAKSFDTYKNNTTLLMLAARDNLSAEVISLLLSLGQEVNAKDFTGRTALFYAALTPNLTAVKKLLSAGANTDFLPMDKVQELLQTALDSSDKELLSLMLKNGVKPEFNLGEDKTLFMYALENSDNDIINLLLKNGADVNFSLKGNYPLFSALEAANVAAIDILLQEKVNKNIVNQAKETPFSVAIRKKLPLPTAESLWNKDKAEATKVLWTNIASIDKERLSFLILKGADLKSKDKDDKTILAKAAAENPDSEIIELLIAKGLKPNSDILLEAVKNSNLDILNNLLKNRFNLNIKDSKGNTPLMLAAEQGKTDFVKSLLASGANARGRNEQGQTALHLAAANVNSSPELLNLLADGGLNVNLTDYGKDTAISLAVKAGAGYDNFIALVKKGAKVKATFDKGNTLLMLAAKYNQDIQIIKYLISEGVSLNSRNKDRKTALDYAKENKNPDIQSLLIKSGAK